MKKRCPNYHPVIRRVAKRCRVRIVDIIGPSRQRRFVEARRQVARELRESGWFTLQEIGDILNRDHSTVMYWLQEDQR